MELTKEEYDEAVYTATTLNLYGAEMLSNAGYELAHKVCNGIGAEWMPSAMREFLDKLNPDLKVVAMIHDLAYYFGDGTIYDFTKRNHEFKKNAYIIAGEKAWYNPLKYLIKFQGNKYANICQHYGMKAYEDAIKERREDESKLIIAESNFA